MYPLAITHARYSELNSIKQVFCFEVKFDSDWADISKPFFRLMRAPSGMSGVLQNHIQMADTLRWGERARWCGAGVGRIARVSAARRMAGAGWVSLRRYAGNGPWFFPVSETASQDMTGLAKSWNFVGAL